MASPARTYLTPEEYLAIEREAEFKSEYFAGEMFTMAGASEPHNLIVGNLVREIGNRFKGRHCRVYPSDMRVKVEATGLYAYPDIVAVCGELEFEGESQDTILNPRVLIEVLPPTTEAYDRGDKFANYQRLESLQEYILVSQNRRRVERFVRQADGSEWMFTPFEEPGAILHLASIGCEIPLAEIYDKVEFAPPGPESGTMRPHGK